MMGIRHGGASLLEDGHSPLPKEPDQVVVAHRNGKVEIELAGGTMVWEPKDAIRFGEGIIATAREAERHVNSASKSRIWTPS